MDDRFRAYRCTEAHRGSFHVMDEHTGKNVRPSAADSFEMAEADADRFADLMNKRCNAQHREDCASRESDDATGETYARDCGAERPRYSSLHSIYGWYVWDSVKYTEVRDDHHRPRYFTTQTAADQMARVLETGISG